MTVGANSTSPGCLHRPKDRAETALKGRHSQSGVPTLKFKQEDSDIDRTPSKKARGTMRGGVLGWDIPTGVRSM